MTARTACSDLVHAPEFATISRRNNSLDSGERFLVFAVLFVVSVGIACAFAALGAWLILPFAGLEMLVLFLAFRYVDCHAADYERVAIDGDRVEVERHEGGRTQRFELNRYWARVVASGNGERLALRSHGRELEIGHFMNDAQRLELARALKTRLG